MQRVLLTTVFRPFCVDGPYDTALHQAQHGTCHRQFTREQGVFTIHQQCSHMGLHLIAANLDAQTDVLEYPSLEEIEEALRDAVQAGRPYDWVGIGTVAAYLPKAERICERVRELSPDSRTVVGGGGAMAIGQLVQPFSDQVCTGDGVAFFRELLGQDVDATLSHPPIWSVHQPNEIFSFRANSAAWSITVALGCNRRCSFCSTSAQFDGRRTRLFDDGAALMAAVQELDQQHDGPGDAPPALQLMFFDENFLSDEAFARDWLENNRQQLEQGRLYLPFVFADARSTLRFTPEELLEMGIDSIWIGMEAGDGGGFAKNHNVDFGPLVAQLQGHGIKVIISLVAGLEGHDKESIARDAERALELGACAFQYAVISPMPGTAAFDELHAQGRLDLSRIDRIGMSHYIVDHPEFDDAQLREHCTDFHRRDYERHGPMSLRYLELRRAGWRKHRASERPALRARAKGFRHDLMDSLAALSTGIVFSPTPELRARSRRVLRELSAELPRRQALAEWWRGELSTSSTGRFLLFTSPVAEPVLRRWLRLRILRWDPRSKERCAGPIGLLRHGRAAVEELRHGMMPFDQPELVVTSYPRPPRVRGARRRGLRSRLRAALGRS